MYEHPLTSEHLRIVREVVRYNVVGPIGKGLACGDVGESRAIFDVASSLGILSANRQQYSRRHRFRSHDRVARHRPNRRRAIPAQAP